MSLPPIDLDEINRLLYLEKNSGEIYLEVLIHGTLSAHEISGILGLPLNEIDRGIKELLEKGLIFSTMDSHGKSLFRALSLPQLEERFERKVEVFQKLKKFVQPSSIDYGRMGLLIYEGVDGIRKVYLEVLEEAIKTGSTIYAIENNLDNPEIGDQFFEKYIERRLRNKVEANVLCPNRPEDVAYQKSVDGTYTKVKLLEDFPIMANVNIVGDLVMTFTTNPAQGTLHRDRGKAETWKAVFKKLWH